jgi:integrase
LVDSETGKPVAPTTRNNFRRLLNVAFNFARDRGYCASNPAAKTAKAKVIETPVGILTVDETTRLLNNASESLIPFIAIGAFAGLRRSELERLDWKEVDLESHLIKVAASKAKSARRRFVKIKPNLLEWLKPRHQKQALLHRLVIVNFSTKPGKPLEFRRGRIMRFATVSPVITLPNLRKPELRNWPWKWDTRMRTSSFSITAKW